MSITLITGTPGSGKTLYAVWMLSREVKAGRRAIVNGIKDLAIDHELVDEEWITQWYEHCRPQDLIVIDEVQRVWPPVSSSVKPTPDIEKLHVHRHMGVDFLIITQHPQRLNKTIRDLIGRHIHVRRLFGMRRAMIYEWDHCHNPNSGFKDAVKASWKYPKKVFGLYTSAEVHTKQKAVIPRALLIAPFALAITGVLIWQGFKGFTGGFGVLDKPGGRAPSGQHPASAPGQKPAFTGPTASPLWKVSGRYAVDGIAYVLLSDRSGHFRAEPSARFRGESLRLEGVVDGDRITPWSGMAAGPGGAPNVPLPKVLQ